MNSDSNPLPPEEPPITPEMEDACEESEISMSAETECSALADWKENLRADVEEWLSTVESIPEEENEDAAQAQPVPDLYTFYEAFAVLSAECRKGNRRAAEAMSQSGEVLAKVREEVGDLRGTLLRFLAPAVDGLPREHCVALVEILDRVHRLMAGFDNAPEASWWQNDRRWRQAWETQRQGLDILRTHVQTLLRGKGITELEVKGRLFDPSCMAAVATEERPDLPDLTVLEEVTRGYAQEGQVLRVAQVKINRKRE